MSRTGRQGYSIRHLLQLPNAARSSPGPNPPTPSAKISTVSEYITNTHLNYQTGLILPVVRVLGNFSAYFTVD
ncbi:unnamed protein product [Pieris brassicae]|uniref:Uncharacterized protein n=1 Tax=Pieris brassicae TaxID=7116 RepID=A0A9P0TRR3_PIEBR|nr:unnamed protein product [Pieris brassicae]